MVKRGFFAELQYQNQQAAKRQAQARARTRSAKQEQPSGTQQSWLVTRRERELKTRGPLWPSRRQLRKRPHGCTSKT